MSRQKGHRRDYNKSKLNVGDKAREVLENIDEDNPVIKLFLDCRKQLDDKHDRYEKIVKISRDITIENKRIIFLLHSCSTDIEGKRETIFEEASARLSQVIDKNFRSIALILRDLDQYQYQKAYTSGLQEFIEAYVFHQFLKRDDIDPWTEIAKMFNYEDESGEYSLLFPQIDYILGIGDFTGELMRRCINNLGIGNVAECFKICNYVRHLHTGFLGIMNAGNKEFGRKAYVLKQSLAKMELVCYNIQIRGSEIPKHMLVGVIEGTDVGNDDDEGYF